MTLPRGKPKPTNRSGFPRTDALNRIAVLADGDYRAVFEASPDAMLIVDSDGVIREHACGITGWKRMRERAAMAGGHLTVDTAPGRETAVRAAVPIMGREHERL